METIALTEETFEETAVLDLDMDEVRGQVARQQAAGAPR
jgi:hypothetical protein